MSRRAAKLLGVPESTLRRQLDKTRADRAAGLGARPGVWQSMSAAIDRVIACAPAADEDLLDRARLLLLDIVCEHTLQDCTRGAALMGVTVPTYKRWREAHAA